MQVDEQHTTCETGDRVCDASPISPTARHSHLRLAYRPKKASTSLSQRGWRSMSILSARMRQSAIPRVNLRVAARHARSDLAMALSWTYREPVLPRLGAPTE